ncbi:hypothetical protein ACFSM9_30730, partial [Microvirga arabica]
MQHPEFVPSPPLQSKAHNSYMYKGRAPGLCGFSHDHINKPLAKSYVVFIWALPSGWLGLRVFFSQQSGFERSEAFASAIPFLFLGLAKSCGGSMGIGRAVFAPLAVLVRHGLRVYGLAARST